MKPHLIYKTVSILTVASLLLTYVPPPTVAQAQAQPQLFETYSPRGGEVIEVQLTNQQINPDGSISASVTLVSKSSLTYGLLFSLESGTVSGPQIEFLLQAIDGIPFTGKETQGIGRITFQPGAHLKIRLNKFGFVPADASMMLGYDFMTLVLLFAGFGYIPARPAEQWRAIGEKLVTIFDTVGVFDTALFTLKLQNEDYIGALRMLATVVKAAPGAFASFLLSEYGISISATVLKNLAAEFLLGLGIFQSFPVILDLLLRPRAVEVDISTNALPSTGAPVDAYLLVDLSGSFADDLPTFKAQAPQIISTLKASNPDTRFGLGKFEDYPISPFGSAAAGDKAYERLVDLSFDTNVVLNTISGLFTRNGADGPQSQLVALFQAATGAGQDLSGAGFPGASIPPGQQANFRNGATKLIILWTDAPFHQPGDPGTIPYPGPSFDETINAIQALDPPKVIGISSGGGGVPDLTRIASATGAIAPPGGVDCNGDGVIDIAAGESLVCSIALSGTGVGEAITALVEAAAQPTEADLAITKADDPDPVMVGQNLTYTLAVTNHGPGTGTGVILTDVLPPGVTFTSATPSQGDCTQADGIVICQLGDLANGANVTVTMLTVTTQGGTITNSTFIAGNEADPDGSNNNATTTTGVLGNSDLALAKSAQPNPINVGQNLTYTLTAINNGPDTATGATVTDTLPAGVTFVSATPSQGTCSEASGTVTCNLGDLANGANATVTIVVTTTASGAIANTASVSGNEDDPDTANNTASTVTDVQANPHIALDKQKPVIANGGGPVTYTYLVTNPGDVPLSTVSISDDKCDPVAYVSGDSDSDSQLDTSETWTFTCTYTPAFTALTNLTNTAMATGTYNTQTVSETDSATLYPFTLRKKVFLYWNAKSTVPYTPLDNTPFTVEVRKGGTLVGTYIITQSTTQKVWLSAGSYRFKEVNLPPGYLAGYSSFSFTTGQGYPDWSYPNVITFDLAIDKSGPTTAHRGDTITYTYQVTNAGPASVKPKVTDNKCSPVTYTSGDTDHDGRVDPGETWNYQCKYKVTQSPNTTLTNTATVADTQRPSGSNFLGGDSKSGNNRDTWTVKVVR